MVVFCECFPNDEELIPPTKDPFDSLLRLVAISETKIVCDTVQIHQTNEYVDIVDIFLVTDVLYNHKV